MSAQARTKKRAWWDAPNTSSDAPNVLVGMHPTSWRECRQHLRTLVLALLFAPNFALHLSLSRTRVRSLNWWLKTTTCREREGFAPLAFEEGQNEDSEQIKALIASLCAMTRDNKRLELIEALAAQSIRDGKTQTWHDVYAIVQARLPTIDEPNAFFAAALTKRLHRPSAPAGASLPQSEYSAPARPAPPLRSLEGDELTAARARYDALPAATQKSLSKAANARIAKAIGGQAARLNLPAEQYVPLYRAHLINVFLKFEEDGGVEPLGDVSEPPHAEACPNTPPDKTLARQQARALLERVKTKGLTRSSLGSPPAVPTATTPTPAPDAPDIPKPMSNAALCAEIRSYPEDVQYEARLHVLADTQGAAKMIDPRAPLEDFRMIALAAIRTACKIVVQKQRR